MKLSQLLQGVDPIQLLGTTDVEVTDIAIDSRQAQPGTLFCAMRGTQTDGHRFIPKAVEQGASVVVCETLPDDIADGVTYVRVADTEALIGPLATTFFGDPTSQLDLIGVTKEVEFVGNGFKIEVWAKENYEASKISNEEFVNIAGKLPANR